MLTFTAPTRLVSTDTLNRFFSAGCSIAARELRYPRVAALIADERLTPERIASLFRSSASKSAKRDAALVILAGSVSGYRAHRESWSPEPATSLCRNLVGDGLGHASDWATRFTRENWLAIEALAGEVEAAA